MRLKPNNTDVSQSMVSSMSANDLNVNNTIDHYADVGNNSMFLPDTLSPKELKNLRKNGCGSPETRQNRKISSKLEIIKERRQTKANRSQSPFKTAEPTPKEITRPKFQGTLSNLQGIDKSPFVKDGQEMHKIGREIKSSEDKIQALQRRIKILKQREVSASQNLQSLQTFKQSNILSNQQSTNDLTVFKESSRNYMQQISGRDGDIAEKRKRILTQKNNVSINKEQGKKIMMLHQQMKREEAINHKQEMKEKINEVRFKLSQDKKELVQKVKRQKEQSRVRKRNNEQRFIKQIQEAYNKEKEERLKIKEEHEQMIRQLEVEESRIMEKLNETIMTEQVEFAHIYQQPGNFMDQSRISQPNYQMRGHASIKSQVEFQKQLQNQSAIKVDKFGNAYEGISQSTKNTSRVNYNGAFSASMNQKSAQKNNFFKDVNNPEADMKTPSKSPMKIPFDMAKKQDSSMSRTMTMTNKNASSQRQLLRMEDKSPITMKCQVLDDSSVDHDNFNFNSALSNSSFRFSNANTNRNNNNVNTSMSKNQPPSASNNRASTKERRQNSQSSFNYKVEQQKFAQQKNIKSGSESINIQSQKNLNNNLVFEVYNDDDRRVTTKAKVINQR